jgi:uncharacterized protein YqeY
MLRQRLKDELVQAMKAKDQRKVATLRLIMAAVKDRDITARTPESREGVDDDEIMQILGKMIRQRQDSITSYEEGGRPELAEQERQEISIIESFLPEQMTDEEIESACTTVMDELEAASLKDMGRTMAALKERYAGKMDFGKAGQVVKGRLS